MAYNIGIHSMSAMKLVRHSWIMSLKFLYPYCRNFIFIAKKTMTKNLIDLINPIKLMLFHFSKMRYSLFSDMKLCSAIFSFIKPLMFSNIHDIMLL